MCLPCPTYRQLWYPGSLWRPLWEGSSHSVELLSSETLPFLCECRSENKNPHSHTRQTHIRQDHVPQTISAIHIKYNRIVLLLIKSACLLLWRFSVRESSSLSCRKGKEFILKKRNYLQSPLVQTESFWSLPSNDKDLKNKSGGILLGFFRPRSWIVKTEYITLC